MDLFRRLFNQSPSESGNTEKVVEQTAEPESVGANKFVETMEVSEVPDDQDFSPSDGATRPLPLESVISTKNNHLRFGQSTDVGMVRNNNQDAVLSLFHTSRSSEEQPDFGLFIVADGMGGHHDGEKASAMTARMMASHVTSQIYLPMLTGRNYDDRPPITETLVEGVQKANADVIIHVPEGGTTLTAVTVIGDLAYIVHVGDSRVYLVTKDGLEQVTRDHSLVRRLIELDQLTEEEAADHPQKNVLYRAIGQSETLEVDAVTRRLPPNSRLLLCSDGFWNQIDDKEIGEIVMSHDSPQEACDKLVALANTRGGTDNISTILLLIPG
ncbi:MAG: protein phosphatase 2C domain-containing protein [Anaerolineae bacterium]|nr:protein phosphatase 2C domain-containing protein [Anaerolineae bacterium]